MDEPQFTESSAEVSESPQTSTPKPWSYGPLPEEITRTMNLREAEEELGLTMYAVYMAVRRREIRVIQPGGKGRKYYLEPELRALADRLAITSCPDNLAA